MVPSYVECGGDPKLSRQLNPSAHPPPQPRPAGFADTFGLPTRRCLCLCVSMNTCVASQGEKGGLAAVIAWLREPTRLASGQIELLKWIAVLTMTVDHVGSMLVPDHQTPFRLVGRVAFPVFAFLIAHNFTFSTRSPKQYMFRIGAFALLSQPIYIVARGTYQLNILFTFLLGLLFLTMWRCVEDEHPLHAFVARAFFLTLLLLLGLAVEYWPPGVLIVPVLCVWLKRGGLAWATVAAALFVLANAGTWMGTMAAGALFLPALAAQWQGTLRRSNRWFFYAYYPVHLVILVAVRQLIS